MQIVSLLVIIPFLLEPASSLVLPAIPDACTHVSPSDRGDVRCGRLTQIQVDNPTRSWWTKPAIGGNQGQNLSARAPGKKKNSDKNKDKDKDKDKDKNKSSKSKGKPKKSSSEATAEKPGGSSSEAPAEKAEGSSPEAPAEKPKESSPGAPTQGTKDSSSGASAEKPGDSSSGAPAEKPEDSSSGTPAEKPEGSSPGSPEQDKGQFSIPDRTKPQQQGDDQTGATENQPGQKPDKGKGKATDNSDEGKPAGVDQKAEGGEQKPQSDEKKQGGDVPLDPNRKNQEGVQDGTSKKDDKTMYNIVTPNPNESKGITSIEDEETSYYRKIGDGNANAKGRYGTHNPHFSAVQSHGQEAKQNGNGRRPGKVEEMATTGAPKPEKDSKKDKGDYSILLSPATFLS